MTAGVGKLGGLTKRSNVTVLLLRQHGAVLRHRERDHDVTRPAQSSSSP